MKAKMVDKAKQRNNIPSPHSIHGTARDLCALAMTCKGLRALVDDAVGSNLCFRILFEFYWDKRLSTGGAGACGWAQPSVPLSLDSIMRWRSPPLTHYKRVCSQRFRLLRQQLQRDDAPGPDGRAARRNAAIDRLVARAVEQPMLAPLGLRRDAIPHRSSRPGSPSQLMRSLLAQSAAPQQARATPVASSSSAAAATAAPAAQPRAPSLPPEDDGGGAAAAAAAGGSRKPGDMAGIEAEVDPYIFIVRLVPCHAMPSPAALPPFAHAD